MKKGLYLLACCLLVTTLHAQTVDWEWAKASNGSGVQVASSVAADRSGNVYMAGYFEGTEFTFADSFLLNSNSFSKASYLVKCNSQGQVIWNKKVGTPFVIFDPLVSTDVNGNVYYAGYSYDDTLVLGDSTFIDSEGSGKSHIYIIKYDSIGRFLWARRSYGNSDTYTIGITADASGSLLLTGYFFGASASTTFGSYNLSVLDSASLNYNLFVAKYSASGNVIWAESPQSPQPNNVVGYSIAANADGSIFITGTFVQSITFGTISLTSYNGLTDENIFIVDYDSSGNVLWANSAGGTGNDVSKSIATDAQGNCYITGYFSHDTVCFGADTLCNTTSANPDLTTMYIAKYGAGGKLLWAKCGGRTCGDQGSSLITDADGHVFVTGEFTHDQIFSFDSTIILPPSLSTTPMFIFTLDTDGNLLCYTSVGAGGNSQNAICTDGAGNEYITSYFSLNHLVIGTDTLHLSGMYNAFLAKFSCPSSPLGINSVEANTTTLLLYPNPFTNQASVQYMLPADSKNASLIIYDMLGRQQSSYPLNSAGGEVSINGNALSAGVYLYSLVVDGRVLVTKRMVVE